jgi:hypothetical protein
MSFNPLTPVTDFQTMLNRVFWFTSSSALVGVWLLRLKLPALDTLLQQVDFTVALSGDKALPIPGGYLFPALAVGILTRIFRLHARISDWLGIRECFDLDVIVAELAARASVDLALIPESTLQKRRHAIMRRAFYPFVSGPRPEIDEQLVHQALDAWSWFWCGIEATLVFTLTGFALIAGGEFQPGLITIATTALLAAIALPVMRAQCRRYAIAQVRAILADASRAQIVRGAFAEFADDRLTVRRAA